MDDLEDLQARVAAAQEKLQLNSDVQRKYGLRLNDVVSIVEGSLARQQEEMKRLQDAAVALRLERDATRVAESQTKSLYEAALNRLNLLQAQNDQLRNMVLTLLNVIEGRESASALQGVLQRLESTVKEITAAPAAAAPQHDVADLAEAPAASAPDSTVAVAIAEAEEIAAEPAAPAAAASEEETIDLDASETEASDEADTELHDEMPAATDAPEAASASSAADVAEPVEDAVMEELEDSSDDEAEQIVLAEQQEPAAVETNAEDAGSEMTDAVAEDLEADGTAATELTEDMPEDLDTLSMIGHRDVVVDADEIVAHEELHDEMLSAAAATAPAIKVVGDPQQDEVLVTALLDAEKALIEAGASGVANANSPVAEIIRRISLRTREFSEASGV